jgi:hypothetical protein
MSENGNDLDRPVGDATTPEMAELQAEIERTRADMADTVDQLTAKLDVKSRVRDQATAVKNNTLERAGHVKDDVVERARIVTEDAIHQARHLQERATNDEGRPTPTTFGFAAGMLAAATLMVVLVVRRNRRSSSWRH